MGDSASAESVCHPSLHSLTWHCPNHVSKWSGLFSLVLKGVSHCFRPLRMRHKCQHYRPSVFNGKSLHPLKEQDTCIVSAPCTNILVAFLESIFKSSWLHFCTPLQQEVDHFQAPKGACFAQWTSLLRNKEYRKAGFLRSKIS